MRHRTGAEEPIAPADKKPTELTISPASVNIRSAIQRQHCAELSISVCTGESIQSGDNPYGHDESAVAELGRDAAWNPQNANPDCSANADRHTKGHSEDAKKPFFAKGGSVRTRLLRLHAFGLADSAPHDKSAALGHLNLDFVLP